MQSQVIRSPLWSLSVVRAVDRSLIQPSAQCDADKYQLGWAVRDLRRQSLQISVEALEYATAEGMVSLLMLREAVRMFGKRELAFQYQTPDSLWERMLCTDPLPVWGSKENVSWLRGEKSAFAVLPPTKIDVSEPSGIAAIVDEILSSVDTGKLRPERMDWPAIRPALRSALVEVLLNVSEHAYLEESACQALLSMTITHVPRVSGKDVQELTGVSLAEIEWLENIRRGRGFILEVAIGDWGIGIPRSLFEHASENTEWFEASVTQLSSATKAYKTARFELHKQLCAHAFRHDSTRKRRQDFANEAVRLGIRGLHRSWQHLRALKGSMVICSGQGRFGYAWFEKGTQVCEPDKPRPADLPGTLVVLRIPLFGPREATPQKETFGTPLIQLDLCDQLVSPRPVLVDTPEDRGDGRIPMTPVVYPFCRLEVQNDQASLFRRIEEASTPTVGLLFADVPDSILSGLRYVDYQGQTTDFGIPRLLCIWVPGLLRSQWRMVGAISYGEEGERICDALERDGHVAMAGFSAKVREWILELTRLLPSLFYHDAGSDSLRSRFHDADLDTDSFRTYLNKAFPMVLTKYLPQLLDPTNRTLGQTAPGTYGPPSRGFVFEASKNAAIRLPTGRLVRRLLSVPALLLTMPVLKGALRDLLRRMLYSKGGMREAICLVAEGPASYYVACSLLPGNEYYITGFPPAMPSRGVASERRWILFADAVFREQTLERRIAEMSEMGFSPEVVIVALDIRGPETAGRSISEVPVFSLLETDFDAQPLSVEESGASSLSQVIELDAVLRTPIIPYERSRYADLSDKPEQGEVFNHHPELFRHGFHVINGRVHTISISTGRLVREHRDVVIQWLQNELNRLLSTLGPTDYPRDLILFYRQTSNVATIAEGFGRLLAEKERLSIPYDAVFGCRLVGVPDQARQIFPLHEEHLLSDVTYLNNDLAGRAPKAGYIGVYLDDAAVTGGSLRDLLNKACRQPDPTLPSALLAIVLVNRLSPAENRFFELCPEFTTSKATNTSPSSIQFRLGQILRLQVKSSERGAETVLHDFVRPLLEHRHEMHPRLRKYLDKLHARLDAILKLGRNIKTEIEPIRHIFYPESYLADVSVSFRTARIRHLLALHQQNEGVLSELLIEIASAVERNDYTLVSLFALDPSLLDEDPIASMCLPGLRHLSLSLLASDCDPSLKSDAIAVIAGMPGQLPRAITEILPLVWSSDELLTFLFAFVFGQTLQDGDPRERKERLLTELWDAVQKQEGREPNNERWIQWRNLLNSARRVHTYRVDDLNDAVGALKRLFSVAYVHSPTQSIWKEVFDSLVGPRTLTTLDESQASNIDKSLRYVADTIIPAMAALRYLARENGNRTDAEKIQDTMWTIEEMYLELSALRVSAVFDTGAYNRFRDAWARFCALTMRATPPYRFLIERGSAIEPPFVEIMLPKYCCIPFRVLETMWKDLNLPSVFPAPEPRWHVAFYTRDEVAHVLRPLLENMCRYGTEQMAKLESKRLQAGPFDELRITLSNKVRKEVVSAGTGYGIDTARTIADRNEFSVKVFPSENEYRVELSFPRSVEVAIDPT